MGGKQKTDPVNGWMGKRWAHIRGGKFAKLGAKRGETKKPLHHDKGVRRDLKWGQIIRGAENGRTGSVAIRRKKIRNGALLAT